MILIEKQQKREELWISFDGELHFQQYLEHAHDLEHEDQPDIDLEHNLEYDLENDLDYNLDYDLENDLDYNLEYDLEDYLEYDLEYDLENDLDL